MITRRNFLETAAATAAAPLLAQTPPKRIAIVTTVYRYLSHAQHMGDRFLIGYPWEGAWHKPNVQVVSLYVDQKPEGDLISREYYPDRFKGIQPEIAFSEQPVWVGDNDFIYLDCSRIKALGWSAKHTIREGVERTARYLWEHQELLTR